MKKSQGQTNRDSLWNRHGESFIQSVANLVGFVLVMGFFAGLFWVLNGGPRHDQSPQDKSTSQGTPLWQQREADRQYNEWIQQSKRESDARERELDAYDKGQMTLDMLDRIEDLERRSRARKEQKQMWDNLTPTKEMERLPAR